MCHQKYSREAECPVASRAVSVQWFSGKAAGALLSGEGRAGVGREPRLRGRGVHRGEDPDDFGPLRG